MERRTIGLATVGLLAAPFVLVITVPIGGTVGVVLFAIVVVLMGCCSSGSDLTAMCGMRPTSWASIR
jgi:hypothetical protein